MEAFPWLDQGHFRTVRRKGKMYSDGSGWPFQSDNAEALYIIEHKHTVKK